MSKLWIAAVVGLLVASIAPPALATAYYVSPTGDDTNDGLSEQTPFKEVQTGLYNATSPGDIVYVMPGLHIPSVFYTSKNKQRLLFWADGELGNPITLTTLPGATEKAIIDLRNVSKSYWGFSTNFHNYLVVDGAGNPDITDPHSFLLEITNVPHPNSTVWCFNIRFSHHVTFRNVACTDADQGCFQHAPLGDCLMENVYARNRDDSYSHVMYLVGDSEDFVVRNCHFTNGGKHGIQVNGAQPGGHIFDSCIIHDNKGAPLTFFAGTGHVVKNCFLYNISGFAENPELIRFTPEYAPIDVEIVNSSLYSNDPSGRPVYMGTYTGATAYMYNCIMDTATGPYIESGNTLVADYNLFWNNCPPFGTNTFTGDPSWVNAAAGDLHIGGGSAALNLASAAYAPAYDIDQDARPLGSGYDLGADEADPNANQSPSVDAGSDQAITLPVDTVSLDGTVSDDGLPDPPGALTTFWTKLSGPGTVSFGDPNAVDTTATFSAAGNYELQLEADDGEFSRTDMLIVTVNPEGGGPVDCTANADIPVIANITGTYVDTQASDDVYEGLQEYQSDGPPKSRYTYMEHKWTIDVGTGGSSLTFYLEAYHTPNSEGDDFVFAYSTDNVEFNNMVTVTKTSDNDEYQTFALPSSLSGTVYIRVVDTDQTAGNSTRDTVYVDHMFIRVVE
ncbi:MAG TPA: right-handed parallel beta-helix repeat-containing protein [Phycisphaerae bacterium]|nr:right-handed parallel beta-helix repeat-containing protein [Phycisphaerae bacterium]